MSPNPYEPPKEEDDNQGMQQQPQDTVGMAILHFAIGLLILIALAILLLPAVRM
jgi:hypothetical protein